MLKVLGNPKRLCDGMTRRDWLEIGGLGLLGAALGPGWSPRPAQAAVRSPWFGKAKSCILLYLYGAPSQLETFDPKPEAPEEIRGELGVIPSVVPGLSVCELLPKTAKVLDRVTVVRSMTHAYPIHGIAYATTGTPTIDIPMELNPRDPRHWPFIGSVVEYLEERNPTRQPSALPRNLALPWPLSTRRKGEVPRAGPYAGFLGQMYDPVWTQFHGDGVKPWVKTLAGETLECRDPYMGMTPASRFSLAAHGAPPVLDRLDRRRSLLEQVDHAARQADGAARHAAFSHLQERAFNLLASPAVRSAFDLEREPHAIREQYGMNLFGQSCLLARRLVEAGGRMISVFWDEYGLAGSGWDTHWNHYPRMREELLPSFDIGFSGLIADLDARGLLDETLVVCLSEHGRTPKLTRENGGGRDHWSRAYSIVLAGAGVARGRVVGRTDRIASDVVDLPVSPKDILATILFSLGLDPETTIIDRLGRPLPAGGEGRFRPEFFG